MGEGRRIGRRNRSEKKEEVDEPKMSRHGNAPDGECERAKERATVDDTGHLSASLHASPNVYGSALLTIPIYCHIR